MPQPPTSKFSVRFKLLNVLGIVAVLLSVAISLLTIDRGFISADEGWYMYLIADRVKGIATQGHLLFAPFTFLKDIYFNRLFGIGLQLASIVLFSYGFSRWLTATYGIPSPFWIVLGLGYLLHLNFGLFMVLAYNEFSSFAFLCSFGLMFLGLVRSRWLYYALSGVFISLLFTIKITCLLILPFELAAIYFLAKRRQKSVIAFSAGFAVGILFYMFVIVSPNEVIAWITDNGKNFIDNPDKSDMHRPHYFIWWIKETVIFYIKWVLVAMVIMSVLWGARNIRYVRAHDWTLYAILLLLCAFYIVRHHVDFFYNFDYLERMIWIAVALVLLLNAYYYHNRGILGLLLLFIAPLCNAFGTDVSFATMPCKDNFLAPILMAGLALRLPERYKSLYTGIIALFFLLAFAIYTCKLTQDLYAGNWHHERYSEQTVELRSIGIDQSIKLDPESIERLNFFRSHIPAGADVICDIDNWGDGYLLGLKPLDYSFKFSLPETTMLKIRACVESGSHVYILYKEVNIYDIIKDRWEPIFNNLSKEYDIKIYEYGNDRCAVLSHRLP